MHLGIRLSVRIPTSPSVSVAIVRYHGHFSRSLPLSARSQIGSTKADWSIRCVSTLHSSAGIAATISHLSPQSLVLLRTAVPLSTKIRLDKVTGVISRSWVPLPCASCQS